MLASTQAFDLKKDVDSKRRYFTGMALLMIAISIAGLLPAIVDPGSTVFKTHFRDVLATLESGQDPANALRDTRLII